MNFEKWKKMMDEMQPNGEGKCGLCSCRDYLYDGLCTTCFAKSQRDIAYGFGRAELIKAVSELESEWNEYALEEDDNLTSDAVKLKYELLKNPFKKVLELLNRKEAGT